MKFKTLRKIDTKEFVRIYEMFDVFDLSTSEMPDLMTAQTTMEDLMKYYGDNFSPNELNIELVELEVNISGEIGADIRNKLTPMKNLIMMLKDNIYITRNGDIKMQKLFKKEIKNCEESITYLKNLL